MLNVLIQAVTKALPNRLDANGRMTDVPGELLQRAEACAGRDPHGAAELRSAALAYLGVVR